MTTIAWDGETLAADKLARYGSTRRTVTKIYRLRDGSLVGGAGEVTFINAVIEWLDAGAAVAEFPAAQRDKDDWQPVLHIGLDGRMRVYERTPHPVVWEDAFGAIGSGKDFAIAGMACGLSAEEAVRLAARFDPDTGQAVDTLRLPQTQ